MGLIYFTYITHKNEKDVTVLSKNIYVTVTIELEDIFHEELSNIPRSKIWIYRKLDLKHYFN